MNDKPKTSNLAKASLLCTISPIIFVVTFFFIMNRIEFSVSPLAGWFIALVLFAVLLAAPILAIIALVKIKKNVQLSGTVISTFSLVVSVLMISFVVFTVVNNWGKGNRIVCATNVKGLGTALAVYANDFDGFIPENWCDALVDEADVYPTSFICTNRRDEFEVGESAYALNKNIIGKKFAELPADIVVLFETHAGCDKSGIRLPIKERQYFNNEYSLMREYVDADAKVYKHRWNQVGGPEILTTEYHDGQGCNILFGDGHAEFVKDIPSLKWEIE